VSEPRVVEVRLAEGCPFLAKEALGGVGTSGCNHPDADERWSDSYGRGVDGMPCAHDRGELPLWCPLRAGPVLVRVVGES
jgi:hypothetical protein